MTEATATATVAAPPERGSPEHTDVLLLELRLRNFKGVKEFALVPAGEDVAVHGDNATGKTTLADACWWLLGGKDSDGRSDFELKRLTEDGSPEHHLDHEVEAKFLISGQPKHLKKVYREKWVKRRGQTDREFDGHTTEHFVDGVPVTAGEFSSIVAEIAPEETMRLLTDPYQFSASMHWKQRRELLLEVCGDVTDADVIASTDELVSLPEFLEGRSLDDHRKVVMARRKAINEELDKIPVRIDEAERALPDVSQRPAQNVLEKDLEKARTEKGEAEKEKTRIESGGQIAEKTKELAEVEARIQAEKNEAKEKEDLQKEELREERDAVAERLSAAKDEVRDAEGEITRADKDIERLSGLRDELRADWEKVNAEVFEHTEPDTCAACGQPLPADQVEAARQKAEEEFNTRKADRLSRIQADGKEAKEEQDTLEADAESRQKRLSEAKTKVEALKAEHDKAVAALNFVSVEPDLGVLLTQKKEIETVIAQLKDDTSDELARVTERIREADTTIERIQEALDDYKGRVRGQQRIEELGAEEKKLASEFEELERQLNLMDLFVKTKVDLLTDRINARFKLARFKLFEEQVNGGISECCEVMYQGVPWGNLNHGAQINVGLDIITTLQEHFGVSLPVWVDQSESVTALPEMTCQMIRLVVSATDSQLRVEEVAA